MGLIAHDFIHKIYYTHHVMMATQIIYNNSIVIIFYDTQSILLSSVTKLASGLCGLLVELPLVMPPSKVCGMNSRTLVHSY